MTEMRRNKRIGCNDFRGGHNSIGVNHEGIIMVSPQNALFHLIQRKVSK
ncbi:hypothetical protein HMPREF9182_1678 [Streptococcus sp. oral taxon 056 str. F0418]|nr:hypothetical protein HMPREF9182_1678 [Streptococcus sp. oral taxon 056 str. F0418]